MQAGEGTTEGEMARMITMYLKCHKKVQMLAYRQVYFKGGMEKKDFSLKKKSLKVFSGIDWKEIKILYST